MHCDNPKANGWERANLVRIVEKKTFEAKRKKKMTRWANNQVLVLGPAQDFKCAQCESQGKSERMLKKEWSNFV
jgi:hypothetical protein